MVKTNADYSYEKPQVRLASRRDANLAAHLSAVLKKADNGKRYTMGDVIHLGLQLLDAHLKRKAKR